MGIWNFTQTVSNGVLSLGGVVSTLWGTQKKILAMLGARCTVQIRNTAKDYHFFIEILAELYL